MTDITPEKYKLILILNAYTNFSTGLNNFVVLAALKMYKGEAEALLWIIQKRIELGSSKYVDK